MSSCKAVIYKKLSEIQSEINVPKERFNSNGNFYYRSAEDILNAVKPILQNKGCVLYIEDDIEVMANSGSYIKATAHLIDCESGEEIVTHAYAKECKHNNLSDEQCTGTASSYARKYCLNGLFLLDDNKDSDSNSNELQQIDDYPEDEASSSFCEDIEESYDEFIEPQNSQPKPNWEKAKKAHNQQSPSNNTKPNWEKSKAANSNTDPHNNRNYSENNNDNRSNSQKMKRA